MRLLLRRQAVLAALTLAGLLASCGVSPTLPPLPPPEEPSRFESAGAGLVLVEGDIPVEEAKVFILNHNTQEIAGQFVHDRHYAIEIEAESGQFMQLWYSVANVESDAVSFDVPENLAPVAEP